MEKKGAYGIVYYDPRLPYKKKYDLKNEKISENEESIQNIPEDEVSKIFICDEDFESELKGYLYLKKFNLNDQLFNNPIYYGIIDRELKFKIMNSYNYKYKKILYISSKQITFKKGIDLKNYNYDLKKFLTDLKNILEILNYFYENKFIFDDLKISNLIFVDNKIKLSDFSSLRKIEDLNINLYNESFLNSDSYYIYNNILNKTLKYFLCNSYNNFDIIKNKDYYEYKDYLIKIINSFSEFVVILNKIIDIEIDNVNINISNLLFQIKLFYSVDNKELNDKFIEYLNNKYDKENIILNLSNRINLFSLGISLIDFFYDKRIFLFTYMDLNYQIKIIKIIVYAVLNFYIKDDDIYFFEPSINKIIEIYNLE